MEQQKQFQCTGDCLRCSPAQRQYCASQHSYDNMRMLIEMRSVINDLKAKVDAIQSGDELIFAPVSVSKPVASEAQSGDGADE